MTTLYYLENVLIARTQTRIPTSYFCIVQESESVPVSESGNVIRPLYSSVIALFGYSTTEFIISRDLE